MTPLQKIYHKRRMEMLAGGTVRLDKRIFNNYGELLFSRIVKSPPSKNFSVVLVVLLIQVLLVLAEEGTLKKIVKLLTIFSLE